MKAPIRKGYPKINCPHYNQDDADCDLKEGEFSLVSICIKIASAGSKCNELDEDPRMEIEPYIWPLK